jgi:hypothetical protein
LIAEHLEFYGGLLLHLLVADLRRLAIAMYERGDAG